MQMVAPGMIAGLHTPGSMQDCLTGMGAMMQCTLAWWQSSSTAPCVWLSGLLALCRGRAGVCHQDGLFMNASYSSVR